MHSLIVFASGAGSNTRALINYFKADGQAKVALIVTNKPNAGVLNIANEEGIPTLVVDKVAFTAPEIVTQLERYNASLIILAGFLWKIPEHLVKAFPQRIINIHPALLPKFGGKGMYGHHVHNAVLTGGEQESGITVHYVNEVYDSGDIILQARCKVYPTDSADTLAGRIHTLEHFYFPRAIEFLLNEM